MKRILPIVIVLCLIGIVFTCLPQNDVNNNTVLTSIDDLNGKSVGIQSGAGYEQYLATKCPDATPVFFNEFSSIYSAIQQGKVDVMITESIAFAVEKLEMPSLVALEEPLETINYSIGVSRKASGNVIHAQLNEFIANLKANGTIDAMKSYWLDNYNRDNVTVDKTGITGEKGVVVFAAEASFEPMCFAGEGGELIGFNVELIYRFCREYGYSPKIETLGYDAVVASLASGRTNVAVGVIPDEERAEEINFTNPIMDFDIIAVYDTGSSESSGFIDNLIRSFNKTFVKEDRWKMFLEGVDNTFFISVLSITIGSVLGLLLYLWVSHGGKFEAKIMSMMCWLTSSTPTVVMLMILYYIIFGNYNISNIAVAIIGFSIVFGCGFYDRIVAGVKAVGNGQVEAALSQGFSENQTFFHIVLPQAAEHFAPAYQGDIIALIQETSVVGYIAIKDLTKMSDLVRGRTYEAFFPLLATAVIYFLLIIVLTSVFDKVTRLINRKNRKKGSILKGIKTNKIV